METELNTTFTVGGVIISALKAMGDNIGGESLMIDNLPQYRADPRYSDRIENMTDVINRGLNRARRFKAIKDFKYLNDCVMLDEYKTPLSVYGIPDAIAAALPLYIKYEMYQADDYRQAYQARDDFDELVRAYAESRENVQKSVVNNYEGWLD